MLARTSFNVTVLLHRICALALTSNLAKSSMTSSPPIRRLAFIGGGLPWPAIISSSSQHNPRHTSTQDPANLPTSEVMEAPRFVGSRKFPRCCPSKLSFLSFLFQSPRLPSPFSLAMLLNWRSAMHAGEEARTGAVGFSLQLLIMAFPSRDNCHEP